MAEGVGFAPPCGGVKTHGIFMRRGWDSNPRCGYPHAGFQDRFLQPLGHLSKIPVKIFLPCPDFRKFSRFPASVLVKNSSR
jgi:hypothetical protein